MSTPDYPLFSKSKTGFAKKFQRANSRLHYQKYNNTKVEQWFAERQSTSFPNKLPTETKQMEPIQQINKDFDFIIPSYEEFDYNPPEEADTKRVTIVERLKYIALTTLPY